MEETSPSSLMACVCTQLCPTLRDSMDCSPPGSSVRGISQARIPEWVTISSSRASSQPRDQTHVSFIGRRILYHWATWEVPASLTDCIPNASRAGFPEPSTWTLFQLHNVLLLWPFFRWGSWDLEGSILGPKPHRQERAETLGCESRLRTGTCLPAPPHPHLPLALASLRHVWGQVPGWRGRCLPQQFPQVVQEREGCWDISHLAPARLTGSFWGSKSSQHHCFRS